MMVKSIAPPASESDSAIAAPVREPPPIRPAKTSGMMLTLLLAAGAATSAATGGVPPSGSTLFAVSGVSHSHVGKLIRAEGAAVLYHHGEFAVVASNRTALPALAGEEVVATSLRDFNPDRSYFVLRNKAKNGTTESSAIHWAAQIQQKNQVKRHKAFCKRASRHMVPAAMMRGAFE